jgi:hypothetical protein
MAAARVVPGNVDAAMDAMDAMEGNNANPEMDAVAGAVATARQKAATAGTRRRREGSVESSRQRRLLPKATRPA